jgi:hypothetical protein
VGERTAAKKKKCDTKTKQKCAKHNLGCEKGKCVLICNAQNSQCEDINRIRGCGAVRDDGSCSPLAEGGFPCAAQLHDPDQNCPAASECERNSDCPTGEVYVDASNERCCGSPGFGICRKQCKT